MCCAVDFVWQYFVNLLELPSCFYQVFTLNYVWLANAMWYADCSMFISTALLLWHHIKTMLVLCLCCKRNLFCLWVHTMQSITIKRMHLSRTLQNSTVKCNHVEPTLMIWNYIFISIILGVDDIIKLLLVGMQYTFDEWGTYPYLTKQYCKV